MSDNFFRWGIDHNIDMIAASFVRKPTDVSEIRTFCSHVINELKSTKNVDRLMPLIVSKIESTEALENFEEILEISDAIMVARGDLAVEIPPETLAGVQMQIVRRCNEVGKPVIVATQMLETMQKNPRPTRAELTDVANAIQEGADCVMLSGESAKGKYPIESVSMMRKIILQTESLKELESLSDGIIYNDLLNEITNVPEDGVAKSAVTLSNVLTASVAGIIVNVPFSATQQELSSHLPQLIAKYRPNVPIFTIVPTYKAGRRLVINRAIQPVLSTAPAANRIDAALNVIKSSGKVQEGKKFVLVNADEAGNVSIGLI